MGARLVFQIIEKCGADLEEVYLLAPDGIHNNFWYQLATGTQLMRTIFKRLVNNEKLLNSLFSIAKASMIIDSKTAGFVTKSISTKERREKVYNTWCYLRKLNLNKRSVSKALNDFSISTIFVVGKKDRIISQKSINSFASILRNHRIIEINAVHHNLMKRYVESLVSEKIKKV